MPVIWCILLVSVLCFCCTVHVSNTTWSCLAGCCYRLLIPRRQRNGLLAVCVAIVGHIASRTSSSAIFSRCCARYKSLFEAVMHYKRHFLQENCEHIDARIRSLYMEDGCRSYMNARHCWSPIADAPSTPVAHLLAPTPSSLTFHIKAYMPFAYDGNERRDAVDDGRRVVDWSACMMYMFRLSILSIFKTS